MSNLTPETIAGACMLTANKEHRQDVVREQWIKTMQARLVREELQKCHRAEGENHYFACSHLAKLYNELQRDGKVRAAHTDQVHGFRAVDA